MRKLHRFFLVVAAPLTVVCALRCNDGGTRTATDVSVAVFGSPGSEEGLFVGPRAIGVGPDSMLYITLSHMAVNFIAWWVN